MKARTDSLHIWDDPIVTEIIPLEIFYPGENYHQNYYQSNRFQPYCISVIDPKMKKFYKDFDDKVVPE